MNEIFWKAGYVILFLIWFFIQVYYWKEAVRHTTKKKIRPGFESFLVALNMVSMHILPLLVIFTPFFDAYAFQVADPVRFIFFIAFAFNIWLFLKAHRDLGKNWSIILEIKDGHRLVTTGIYKKIRHPIYTHFWIWVITQGIILANGLVLAFGIASWGLLYFLRVPKEEEMLIAEFGDEYREYMKNTGRIIPKF
jgi:protein-S-isoprenylcysteine O-methyltransferase Ste14